MTALISRLEQAGEGSRVLDAEIGRAFGGQVVARFGDYDWRAEGVGIWRALPLFTRSLDDALALAGRLGWPFWSGGKGTENAWAHLYDRHPDQDGPTHNAKAATPALALCIAILRATNPKGQPNV